MEKMENVEREARLALQVNLEKRAILVL